MTDTKPMSETELAWAETYCQPGSHASRLVQEIRRLNRELEAAKAEIVRILQSTIPEKLEKSIRAAIADEARAEEREKMKGVVCDDCRKILEQG